MSRVVKVAVLGATGYVGMELVNFLNNHPNVKINFLGSDSFKNIYLENKNLKIKYSNLPLLQDNKSFNHLDSDCVFLCLPHSVSNKYVKKFFGKIKIIDLSADFRLRNFSDYVKYYGNNHECKQNISSFVYGLPEIYKDEILNSDNIAIPGCYPTSILLPLIPLVKKNIINLNSLIIDSKSGYSGAGKSFDINIIKSDLDYNFFNYNTNTHRHISEINQELKKFSNNQKFVFSFNPHILPNFRGMMSTIYCDLNNKEKKQHVIEIFKKFEKNNYFINFIDDNNKLDFFSIQNSNFCKIKLFDHPNENKIIIVSLIDNLIKGASGQAIQCFNISENFDETLTLV